MVIVRAEHKSYASKLVSSFNKYFFAIYKLMAEHLPVEKVLCLLYYVGVLVYSCCVCECDSQFTPQICSSQELV